MVEPTGSKPGGSIEAESGHEPHRREPSRRKPRTAFVLSGGGNLGALQVGMLRALVEAGIRPDVVLGCSIGAINGAAFALDPSIEGVDRLASIWESPTVSEMMPSSRIPSAVQMVRRGSSIYDNEPLRAGICAILGDRPTFDDLELPFRCNAVDVDSATTKWFYRGNLIEPLLASAALPAVYPPVEIDGHTYIDGGVIENVPIAHAVELGCRTIYVLHMGAHGRPTHELRRPIDGALQAYWVARNSQFARDLAGLPDRVRAIVLPPGRRPDLKHDDFSQTAMLIDRGYQNTSRFLQTLTDTGDRRRAGELLKPLERLVIGARSLKWLQRARDTAVDPEGGVVAPDESDSSEDGTDPASGATISRPSGPMSVTESANSDGLSSGTDDGDQSESIPGRVAGTSTDS